jgi:hypothetical protein
MARRLKLVGLLLALGFLALALATCVAWPTMRNDSARDLVPSRTPTPRPSFTPAPTRTPTPTANWAVQHCPELAVTVDGALTEWAAVTPVALNVAQAAAVFVAPSVRATWTLVPTALPRTGTGTPTLTPAPTLTPRPTATPAPAVADLAALFYCAHDGAGTLYLAGNITDTALVNAVGSLTNGDAASITLDLLADGLRQPRQDDHDLTLAWDGRLRDYDAYPFAATAATDTGLTNAWRFELAIPPTSYGDLPFFDGAYNFGATWGYYDNRGGATWAYRLLSAKRRLKLE